MKKYLPFLWLLPNLSLVVSFLVMGDAYDPAALTGAIVMGLCIVAQTIIPFVYYFSGKKNFKMLTLVAGPVLYAVMILANLGRISEAGFAYAIIFLLPAALSVMCMYTLRNQDKKQEASETPVSAPAAVPVQNAPLAEVKQLKELLDMGAITQEEFDAKKKQLLGL